MTKHSYLKFCVLLLIIAGCEEYKYCIEMKPFNGGIERKIICSGSFSDEELERIAGLYENRINHHTFSGRFDANLPKDVGGTGFYMSFMTNMGQTTVYSERFQGDDDLYVKLNQINQGVDHLIDFLIGWMEYELGDDPNFEKLHEFCDNNLRRDCKNFLYYLWLEQILSEYQDDVQEEFGMRAMHYLFERNYISQKELPLLFGGSKESAYNFICRFVAGKMGYSDPNVIAGRLKFLSEEEHLEQSMERYIATTDLYKKIWETKKIKESDPNSEPPKVSDILCSVLEEAGFEFDLFPPTYTIEVKLNCDNVPYTSNGKWDEQAQQVIWSVKTIKCYFNIVEIPSLPTYFYCSWSTPDRKFQEEHFGRVILDDEDLAQYCIWRESLDEGQNKEWDSFVLCLNPGEDLEGRLKAFRFSVDQQKGLNEEVNDLAKVPRELILAGLKAEKEDKDDIKKQTVEE